MNIPRKFIVYQGVRAGAAVGGVAGALLDRHNPWRGGVIGAVLGGVFGGAITEFSARGANKAAVYNQPVEYRAEEEGLGRRQVGKESSDGSLSQLQV